LRLAAHAVNLCRKRRSLRKKPINLLHLTRRQFIQITDTAGAAGLAPNPAAVAQPDADKPKHRPNLLFVFSDQQSWDMLGCYGNDSIRTPHLDRFADTGVRFNHGIANAPLCTPYRGILLSGRHPLHNGAVHNDWQMLPDEHHFGHVLGRAGYRTGYVGKWHLLGGPRDRPIPLGPLRYGFDDDFLSNNCALEYRAGKSWYWDHHNKRAFYDKWEPDAQTDQAIDFLRRGDRQGEDGGDDRPWALFVSWHPPHNWTNPDAGYPRKWCYDAPDDVMARYDRGKLRLRPNSADNDEQRLIYHGYHALCSNLDDNFGRLIAELQRRGELENTVIVYTSDHGDCLRSEGRFDMHKRRPEADSARVPMLLRSPGLGPRESDLLIGTFDLMPTLLSMLGLEAPATCHGRDLTRAIADGDDDAVESQQLFISGPEGVDWRGLYTRRHTYSFGPDGKRFDRLYDRKADPWEQHNLFADAGHAALREKLHAQTLEWMRRFDDRLVPYEKNRQSHAGGPLGHRPRPPRRHRRIERPADRSRGRAGRLDQVTGPAPCNRDTAVDGPPLPSQFLGVPGHPVRDAVIRALT